MQFRAFEPGIEVNGVTVKSIVAGFGILTSLGKARLKESGLPDDIVDDKWYSQEKWLQAFKSIALQYGDETLFRIGLKIPESAIFPEWVKTIDDAIKSIDFAYHMNHRKKGQAMFNPADGTMMEGIGHYGYKRITGQNLIVSVCENPYPCSFDKGIITSMAKKFRPNATVNHDDSKPCRKNGADTCAYLISW